MQETTLARNLVNRPETKSVQAHGREKQLMLTASGRTFIPFDVARHATKSESRRAVLR